MKSQVPQTPHTDESILVISRDILFKNNHAWQGINSTDTTKIIETIKQNESFMARSLAETDLKFKQIIPYLIFTIDRKIFVMQRKASASEQRLAGKHSIGIGGHIGAADITDQDVLNWSRREFYEEVSYSGKLRMQCIGILNDDSSEVGQVHLGIIILAKGSHSAIAIKDEHKSGILMPIGQCWSIYSSMESWSQTALEFIENNNLI